MSITTKVLTKGTALPINQQLIKQYLREDFEKTNVEITALQRAAVTWAENYTYKSWIKQTRSVTYDGDDLTSKIILPYSPILNIIEVRSVDTYGTVTIIDVEDYTLNNDTFYTHHIFNTLEIDYECGYDDVRQIPDDVKLAIVKKMATDYLAKEDVSIGLNLKEFTFSTDILDEYKTIILI